MHEALNEIGVEGMTVSEVKGYGRQKGHSEIYRGAEYQTNFLPKIKIEIVVPKARTTEVTSQIQKVANSGKIGDGKIFVQDVNQVIRIRTSESGADAL